jgi:dTDP-4-amino-4,6-dideoxygalactose transaminase
MLLIVASTDSRLRVPLNDNFCFMLLPFLDLKAATAELRTELDAAHRRVADSGWFLLGRELEAFEAEYAASVGVAHCIGVANGLEALQLVLLARGIGAGDEVIVPSNGYIATWLAVTHVGATPIPCEPDARTYNLDPARLAPLLTPRTKAIIPIHLYGQTADMTAINAFAAAHGLFVLEDAAQSHGARAHGRASGALGHAAGISFYPTKNLGALADAGAITTDDATLAARLRSLRNYGSRERYHHDEAGLNSRLDEFSAAFLRVKLPHLAAWNTRRAALAERYLAQLSGVGDLVLPFVPAWAEPVWHLFVVRTAHREALRAYLAERGIATQIHYPIPPHRSGAYRSLGYQVGAFPLAEQLAAEVLSLPISPHHTAEQIDSVSAVVRSFFDSR